MPQKAKYPVVRKFTVDTGGTSDVYVDIGQCLSLINHRLYRQGRMYRVRVSVTTPISTSIHAVTTLPDTWWARAAYNKARHLWMKRVEDVKELQGSKGVGRWNDFKIGYDAAHLNNFSSALKPVMVTDATGTQANMPSSNEEWALSELTDNDGHNNTFRFFGTATTTNVFNVLDAFELSDNTHRDPDLTGTGTGAYGDFGPDSAGGDTNMDTQGDYPPYHETDFPQLEVLQGQLTVTADMGTPANGQGIQRS